MRISKKAEYAMRAVIAVAKAPGGKPLPLAELAVAEGIPQRFLEQIVLFLRRGGILESRRGSAGGYLLARPATTVSLAEVLELVDGPVHLMESGTSTAASGGALTEIFGEIEKDVSGRLASITIDEVVARDARSQGSMAYEI